MRLPVHRALATQQEPQRDDAAKAETTRTSTEAAEASSSKEQKSTTSQAASTSSSKSGTGSSAKEIAPPPPPSWLAQRYTRVRDAVVHEAQHYWSGTKLLWLNTKTAVRILRFVCCFRVQIVEIAFALCCRNVCRHSICCLP